MIVDTYGMGDDQDSEKYETVWEEFGPEYVHQTIVARHVLVRTAQ